MTVPWPRDHARAAFVRESVHHTPIVGLQFIANDFSVFAKSTGSLAKRSVRAKGSSARVNHEPDATQTFSDCDEETNS
jgi:hypothetical protein